MKFEHLKYFVEIAHCSSINKAAKNLFISQPTLTSAIQSLEKDLGFQLLKRSRQGVALTEKGAKVFFDAEKILEMEKEWRTLNEQEIVISGNVFVTVLPSVCPHILNQSIRTLKQSYPQINVCLYEGRKHTLLRQLEKKEATIGLTAYLETEREIIYQFAKAQKLIIQELFTDQLRVFVRADHPLTAKANILLEDLKTVPVVTYAEKDMLVTSYIHLFNQSQQYLMNNLNGMMTAIIDNDCAAVCTQSFAYENPFIQSGLIKMLDVSDFNIPFYYCLLYNAEKYRTDAETIVLQQLHKNFSQLAQNITRPSL